MSVYFIGTDIHAPLISMESKLVAQLSETLKQRAIPTRLISILFSKPEQSGVDRLYVRGLRSGPLMLRKMILALTLITRVWRELRRAPQPVIFHFVWVGAPLVVPILFALCRVYHARVLVTILNSRVSPRRYSGADQLVVQSEAHRRKVIQQLGPDIPVQVIRPAAGVGWRVPGEVQIEDYFMVASGPFSVNQISELGVPVLFEAFAILARRGLPMRLRYISRWADGEAGLATLARESGADNIEFITGVRDDMAMLMAASRAVIVPFVSGADVPMSAVEALAAGVPVIASDALGMAEDIRDSGAGLAFRSGDAMDLAHAIREVWQNGTKMRKRARAMSASYNLAQFEQEYRDVYAALGIGSEQAG